MHREILEQIGLNKNEAIIYEVLLSLGESTLAVISNETGIHRRNALDSLKSLARRGLVFEIHDTTRVLYQAVDPNKLIELHHERGKALNSILPSLQTSYKQIKSDEKVFVYRGVEGLKNNLRDIIRIGKPLYEIGAKGGWLSPELGLFYEPFIKELKKKKISHYHIYDYNVKDNIKEDIIKKIGGEYRFFPKEFSTDSAIHIFGDHIVSFSGLNIKKFNPRVTLFVAVNRKLADSYRVWFNCLWSLLK